MIPPEQNAANMLTPEQRATWAWLLDDVRPCVPVPAKGALGLWDFPEWLISATTTK
jgi:hypothetical protein